ncbi:galactose oxidase [uncultured Psychrosphaera sp.]|uniref:Kelch repeat-containing protein n=1 Tax=uncultured Psychrosphaera sp. TaxID=1403522 RepID=UPI002626D835|nr:galactose oxidase [uncultured Psychrosphaera sp.]
MTSTNNLLKTVFIFSAILSFQSHAKLNLPPLPEPVTNNAVASVIIDGKQSILSFSGLSADKKITSMHNKAWRLDVVDSVDSNTVKNNTNNTAPNKKSKSNGNTNPESKTETKLKQLSTPKFSFEIKAETTNLEADFENQWQAITPLPSLQEPYGRIGSTAVGVNDSVYIFGGYNLGSSKSFDTAPGVYKYHVPTDTYVQLEPMPVSVNDAVTLVYRDRYIYAISGWNNDAAVNLVQVFDTLKNEWFQASPFIGTPVFGHAGGIVDNVIMICDGAKVTPQLAANRTITQQASCYLGEINVTRADKISWYQWVHPTDVGRFKMAAAGDTENDRIIFVGGTNAPHDGAGKSIGSNSQTDKPLTPNNEIWIYNIAKRSWQVSNSPQASMDHRGLLNVNGNWITLGGMIEKQQVTDKVTVHIKE